MSNAGVRMNVRAPALTRTPRPLMAAHSIQPIDSRIAPSGPIRSTALAALAGLLVALPFLVPELFVAGWIALVPLLIALENRSLPSAWGLGLVAGLTTWAVGSYWMADFFHLFKGYPPPSHIVAAAVYWVYAAHAFAMAALVLQWLRRATAAPDIILVPVVIVGTLNLFPLLFPLRPAEGQTLFLPAIQGVDLGGVLALDLLMALAATLLYEQCRAGRRRSHRAVRIAAVGLLLAWFSYGVITLHDWRAAMAEWATTRVGVVQPNDPPSQGVPPLPSGYSRLSPPELDATRELAESGADLVVWPEARYKGYHRNPGVRHRYHQAVREMDIILAFQDAETVDQGDGVRHYNTGTVLDADGSPAGHYRKMRRVPFGEYLPLADTLPWLGPMAEAYFGEFMEALSAGAEPAAIEAGNYRLVQRICYETAFPKEVARGIDGETAILVVHSMNNWFGETHQPSMHLRSSILRAVENRIPMVHAINNGPSGMVSSDGSIIAITEPFRQDTLIADLPVSPQSDTTVYNRFPYTVPAALNGALGLLIILAVAPMAWRRRR